VRNIRDCRAMSSLFRQFAVFNPVHSSRYLIEAQKWEHLAKAEITSHFKECNTTGFAEQLAPAGDWHDTAPRAQCGRFASTHDCG